MIECTVTYALGDDQPVAHLLYGQDVRESLKLLPAESVHVVCTSPPYWGLRDYGGAPSVWGGDPDCAHEWGEVGPPHHPGQVEQTKWKDAEAAGKGQTAGSGQFCNHCDAWFGQLGLEPTPQLFVAHLVEVFREVRRVLRPDGVVWVNLGDSYANDAKWGGCTGGKHAEGLHGEPVGRLKRESGLKGKDLAGVPWRVALGLQDDGWWLRSDVIWCLSGGAWVYARSQKGDMPMMVKDLERLDPSTIQLWNGEKWTQLLGVSKSNRQGDELEIVLRSGERISCTPNHQWPTSRGLVDARDLVVGDVLDTTTLPEPEHPHDSTHIGLDAAWFVGLFLAEGSWSGDTIQIAGHAKEEDRWMRVQEIAVAYGGSATRTVSGNKMNIRVYGKMLVALLRHFLTGRTAQTKGLDAVVWRYSNAFLDALLDGYLHGDGTQDGSNDRWRLGFCRNYKLERDLRTISARLGYTLTLKPSHSTLDGRRFPSFRGELRKDRRGHHNEKPRSEIMEVRKARCRQVYDLGVADEPHLFALASGVLTHNSKGNPMPESVRDRPTRAHEYIFLLAKSQTYFYDADAIREGWADERQGASGNKDTHLDYRQEGKSSQRPSEAPMVPGRNKRTVWTINPKPYPGAHFAVWPEELVEPMIKAGSSEHGCCSCCLAPYQRVTEVVGEVRNKWGKASDEVINSRFDTMTGGSAMPGIREGIQKVRATTGWEPTCSCEDAKVIPCTVLDTFSGSATTGAVAMRLGRNYIGTDLQGDYLPLAKARLEGRKAPKVEKEPEPDLIGDLFG